MEPVDTTRVVTDHQLEPGQPCPTCERRIPYPRKDTSPDTRSFTLRVPIDEAEEFEEIFEAAAKHIGAHSNPHWRYRTALWGLVLALQSLGETERLREAK